MLGFLERSERSYSILTDIIDTGSPVGSRDASGEDSKADIISSGSRKCSRSSVAKDFTEIISPLYDSSIIGIVPGDILGTITFLSTLPSTDLDIISVNTYL